MQGRRCSFGMYRSDLEDLYAIIGNSVRGMSKSVSARFSLRSANAPL